MADHDQRGADLSLNVLEGFDHRTLDHDVKSAGWLVGDYELRFKHDGQRDAHALFHAAAEFVRVELSDLGIEADALQQLVDTPTNLLAAKIATVGSEAKAEKARARTAESPEREAIWAECVANWPNYDIYQSRTDRLIPVEVIDAAVSGSATAGTP